MLIANKRISEYVDKISECIENCTMSNLMSSIDTIDMYMTLICEQLDKPLTKNRRTRAEIEMIERLHQYLDDQRQAVHEARMRLIEQGYDFTEYQ